MDAIKVLSENLTKEQHSIYIYIKYKILVFVTYTMFQTVLMSGKTN